MTKRPNACFVSLSFAGLVVLARSLNPIPSRTRPLNSSAPMVLWLKPWESRSLPGLQSTDRHLLRETFSIRNPNTKPRSVKTSGALCVRNAGNAPEQEKRQRMGSVPAGNARRRNRATRCAIEAEDDGTGGVRGPGLGPHESETHAAQRVTSDARTCQAGQGIGVALRAP